MTRALVVLAHPLPDSLCAALAGRVVQEATASGWTVEVLDLYGEGFDPRLSPAERSSYYNGFQGGALAELDRLRRAEVLILVFPTWWFGFPAILKGWFDRVWAPGTAYDHAPGFGPMIPRLGTLREVLAVTVMGAPAWVDWLVMRRPLRRVLAWGIVKPCAPQARVTWRALYRAEAVEPVRLARFQARLRADMARIAARFS